MAQVVKSWGAGAYDNESAQSIVSQLGYFGQAARIDAVRVLLDDVLEDPDCVLDTSGAEAVAAAAMVAGRCAGGERYVPDFGPTGGGLPDFPRELYVRAAQALDVVLGPGSDLARDWALADGGGAWRREVVRMRDLLRSSGDNR
ncbi:DUF4259 domain-containing protein [Yinghuangia seranimata]|uniref:DUF4259 domain-containing protein n=1 Tax=Yinghuangia seranimata TaxID=408067 RepID=UPI00248B702B|nr:DUF4259 domain-containing protein [Yinghuangia seranimata]MDI2129794.1 DUF4259 domain-containing protein [Yinghuangia seranimata]